MIAGFLPLLEDEDRFGFESTFSNVLQSDHFAQLKVQGLDQTPAIVLRVSEEDSC